MRSHTRVFVGNLVFIAVCCSAAPFFLLVGCSAWSDYPGWDWPAMLIALGLVGTVMIPVLAFTTTTIETPVVGNAKAENRTNDTSTRLNSTSPTG